MAYNLSLHFEVSAAALDLVEQILKIIRCSSMLFEAMIGRCNTQWCRMMGLLLSLSPAVTSIRFKTGQGKRTQIFLGRLIGFKNDPNMMFV
jgi:hypothetical protein